MRVIKNVSILVVIALCLAGGYSWLHRRGGVIEDVPAVQKLSEDSLRLSSDAMKNLVISSVHSEDFPDVLSLMGKISATEEGTGAVPARVSGRVEHVYVASGETVQAGQLLATVFSPDFAVAKEEYFESLKQYGDDLAGLSRKKLKEMGLTMGDIRGLKPGGVSLNFLPIHAPRSGAILDKRIVVGNVVSQGDVLFTIFDLRQVWFAGDLYPEDLAKVHKNQKVVIDPVTDGAPPIHGTVSFISPAVDASTRTIKIRALMDNPGGLLRADMYVQGNLVLSDRKALVMPKSAVVRLRDEMFCYRRIGQTDFQKVKVAVGREHGNLVPVTQGLREGDEVVTQGGLLLEAALTGG